MNSLFQGRYVKYDFETKLNEDKGYYNAQRMEDLIKYEPKHSFEECHLKLNSDTHKDAFTAYWLILIEGKEYCIKNSYYCDNMKIIWNLFHTKMLRDFYSSDFTKDNLYNEKVEEERLWLVKDDFIKINEDDYEKGSPILVCLEHGISAFATRYIDDEDKYYTVLHSDLYPELSSKEKEKLVLSTPFKKYDLEKMIRKNQEPYREELRKKWEETKKEYPAYLNKVKKEWEDLQKQRKEETERRAEAKLKVEQYRKAWKELLSKKEDDFFIENNNGVKFSIHADSDSEIDLDTSTLYLTLYSPITDEFPYEAENDIIFEAKINSNIDSDNWIWFCYDGKYDQMNLSRLKECEPIPEYKVESVFNFSADGKVDYETDDPRDFYTNDLNEFLSKFNIKKSDFYTKLTEFATWYITKEILEEDVIDWNIYLTD